MSNLPSPQVEYVLRNYSNWKLAVDHVSIEYVAVRSSGSWVLSNARVLLAPNRLEKKISDVVETSEVRVGQIRMRLTPSKLDVFLCNLQAGWLKALNVDYRFPEGEPLSIYSPSAYQQIDYSVPQLEIRVDRTLGLSQQINFAAVNNELRIGEIPFDGLADLLTYYHFSRDGHFPNEQKISISIRSPADFEFEACSLSDNRLKIQVRCKAGYGREQLTVAIRQFPNPDISRRRQVASLLSWIRGHAGFEFGSLEMDLENCTAVELMLCAGGFSVQQVFITDKNKSLNPRLAVYQRYDPELQQLRGYLDPHVSKSRHLEQGVATLLYLLGAVCSNPPATDAPDIIAETRAGRLAIVECTVKITDMREKAGKLINRRHALTFNADGSGPTRDVLALLVVSLPKNKIPLEEDFLAKNQILLVTREDIDAAMKRLEFPPDLEELYTSTTELLQRALSAALGMVASING